MRALLLSVIVCCILPALAANDLARCAGIESAVERLDCFDNLARQASKERPATDQPEPAPTAPEVDDNVERFGKEKQSMPVVNIEHITARIESIGKTPLGHHIITLSNGQIWVENEPGRRRIAPAQDVIIRKHRFHFEMELASQPNVAVRRLE